MPPVDPGRLKVCPRVAGLHCPADPCPATADPGLCAHIAALAAWRGIVRDDQAARITVPRPGLDPSVRDRVNACPDRGPVLPLSQQDDCGCRGRELSECRAGKGAIAGRVTLRDCLECRSG